MRLRPCRTLDDKIEGAIVTFIDVTERRHAEARLRESETRLLLVCEAADLGTLDYTTARRELWCDARALALWGLKPDAKPTLEDLLGAIRPADIAATRNALDKALDPAGPGPYEAEFRLQALNGGPERWIRTGRPPATDGLSSPSRMLPSDSARAALKSGLEST